MNAVRGAPVPPYTAADGAPARERHSLERTHQISRAVYTGLVVILVGLVAFAIAATSATKTAAAVAGAAVHQSTLLADARYEVGSEESLERKYLLEPSPAIRARHRDAARRLDADLREASRLGGFDEIIMANRHYRRSVGLLFAAVDAHDRKRTLAVDNGLADPAFTAVQQSVLRQTALSQTRTIRALDTLRGTADQMQAMTIVVSAIGLVLLGIVFAVLCHYKRAVDDAMTAELNRFKAASLTDSLTGLGNHRAYQEDLVRNIAACWATGSVVTVALVDVDELKVLNDRSGHVTGDRLLASLAKVLRAADLESVPYRLGGDEFALAFVGMSSAVAKVRMEQVRSAVEAQLGGTTVSIGISTTSPMQPDLLVVREQADAALYEAKRRGRNSVVVFDDIRDEHPVFSPARVAQVRRLIAAGTIGVAFQPIWSIDERTVIGYEALARPGGSDPINPQDAFDIAERIGKAHELDRVCRNAVLAKASALPADELLFLNISPQSLDHNELRGTALVRAVEAAGLTPQRVVLEITERSVARLDVVVREATRLRALGFRLALDDAGSGNAGLEMLSKLVVDYVKIDREVIVRALAGTGGRGVLAGIIAIAHEMRAQIVAEGIEDSAMLELVRRATSLSPMDCAVQGYYLGRPQANFVDVSEAAVVLPRLAGPRAAQHAGNGIAS